MSCHAAERDRVQRAARATKTLPPVVDATVVEPAESNHDAWTLELVLDAGGLPAVVTRELAIEGLTIREARSWNGFFRVVVVV